MRHVALIALSLSLFGCASVFRGSKDMVTIESTPTGAEATVGSQKVGVTPTKVQVKRAGTTQITVAKPGYEPKSGIVTKSMNGAWLTLDILTCPFTLCVPLTIDAVTGAWRDVSSTYRVTLMPENKTAPLVPAAPTSDAPAPKPTPAGPPADMSEAERKAIARAAYLEGVKLQDGGNCVEALSRLEVAQRFFSAPTHLVHIAQCQAATGKLVEAAETYESLVRTPLGKDAPDAFRHAQEDGKKELAQLKPRIPTLLVQVTPAPSSLSQLVVKINGYVIPNEILGLARPVNPGKYLITASAAGYLETRETLDVGEGGTKSLTVKLSK